MSFHHAPDDKAPSERVFIRTTPRYELHGLRRTALALTTTVPTAYTLYGLLHGRGRLLVAHERFDLHPEMTALLNPATRHSLRCRDPEIIRLYLPPALIADVAARLRLTRIGQEFTFHQHVVADPRLATLWRSVWEELQQADVGHDMILDALVDQILVHLFRHHFAVRRNLDLEFSRFGFVDRRLRRAIEFIHTHFDGDVRLKDMARAAFMSTFHFARLFKRVVGMTPHAYLMGVRLEQAARLLRTTDLSMLEISQRIGYASQSHFAKAFKAWTGLTPREYRQASCGSPPVASLPQGPSSSDLLRP
ncbi:MAG: AraC family transcriptional regulator [Blastocatellia bacterium]|nr:AraC family transcriptional regulator [Blastocatellia bacterium]MCS7158133.1 AraC family transcriptional regulator [Blastocatellia bacterium]MCX7753004.1 AraC family transcriptional regulator [Blastocatellia bacterium]MDW8168527.1 AraC family transcriptional regulator [Acidobacteriota bacterium]MDW8256941.1 AraC family transcriptional regulator [Acidobacteriota bacterium]